MKNSSLLSVDSSVVMEMLFFDKLFLFLDFRWSIAHFLMSQVLFQVLQNIFLSSVTSVPAVY